MKTISAILFMAFLLSATRVLAGPPMKVLYSKTVSTNFKWHWPAQTVRTTSYIQTKPYFYTGQLLNLSQENVSKYRHYYQYMAYKNPWGYFFPPGQKLGQKAILTFGPLDPAYQYLRTTSYK